MPTAVLPTPPVAPVTSTGPLSGLMPWSIRAIVNGGFGMLLDGSVEADQKLSSMLHWDVNNGIARRSWARNEEAQFAIRRAMEAEPRLKVTLAQSADPDLIRRALS